MTSDLNLTRVHSSMWNDDTRDRVVDPGLITRRTVIVVKLCAI